MGASRIGAPAATLQRAMALGPAAGGTISDELLEKLGTLSTQSLIDGLWVMGWPTSFIEGARGLEKGMKCCGRAVTLNFVPQRPDIAADKPAGMESPEYEAFEKCGPQDVLVMASVGKWESVGGDIKFLRLKQREIGGLVTDGSVRDTDELLSYGFPVFSFSTTPKQGPAAMQPWECNGVINCGGVSVRPGDAIIGDQDGVVCVPASHAQQVFDIAHGREIVEVIIKEELTKSNPTPRLAPPRGACLALSNRASLQTGKPRPKLGHLAQNWEASPGDRRRAAPSSQATPSHPPPPVPGRPRPPWQVLSVQAADQTGVAAWQAAHRKGYQVPAFPGHQGNAHSGRALSVHGARGGPSPHVVAPVNDEGVVTKHTRMPLVPHAADAPPCALRPHWRHQTRRGACPWKRRDGLP